METADRQILSVSVDEKGVYKVEAGTGSSVQELAFCVMVIIKCLSKSELIKNTDEFMQLVNKYMADPQYEEVKDEQN